MAEQQGPPYGFPLVSDKRKGGSELLAGDRLHVKIEDVYEPTDDRFGHGDVSIGRVAISHGEEGNGPLTALFVLDDGSQAAVVGDLPGSDRPGLWNGRSMVHVDKGTGGFEPWVGQDIPLESENPKRWG